MKIAILILIILVVVVWMRYWLALEEKKRLRKIDEIFVGRKELSPTEFYVKYFKSLGVDEEIALGVRSVLEEQLDADLSRLSSSDSIHQNLGYFFEIDSMADVEILIALEERFNIKITDSEAEATKTIKDLVCLVQRKRVNA